LKSLELSERDRSCYTAIQILTVPLQLYISRLYKDYYSM